MSALNPTVVTSRVTRARSACGLKVIYHMGQGGFNFEHPTAPEAFNWDHDESDCSGFLSALMCTKRAPKPGVRDFWIETTAMIHDVKYAQQCFVRVKGESGCFVAYGDSAGEEGHCATVLAITRNANGSLRELIGIDCSHGSYVKTGDAIHEREITHIFNRPDAVFFAFKQDLV